MKIIKALVALLVLGVMGMSVTAQSNVNYFFTACEDRAVVELNGTMNDNFDIYVQFFLGAGATGEPLTGLTRMNVGRGDYNVTRVVSYTGGEAPLGVLVSMYVAMASNPNDPVYTDIIDDFQDGCVEPAVGATTITGMGVGEGDVFSAVPEFGVDPRTGQTVNVRPGELIESSGIPKPGGGILNEIYALHPESVVHIGARPSEQPGFFNNRMPDAGLIYAECRTNALSAPGILYDTDHLVVYWNWWAVEAEQVYDHMRNAQYAIRVAGEPMPFVEVSPVFRLSDGFYYVFYTADLGSGWRPGHYEIDFQLTWEQAITDGVDDYGPGTENDFIRTGCGFSVRENPHGTHVNHRNPSAPLQQHLQRR